MLKISRLVLLIFIFLGLAGQKSYSQSSLDLTGHWKGVTTASFSKDLASEFHFVQTGLALEGYSTIKSYDGKDSSRYTFTGSIKNGEISIRGVEFIYKTPLACLSQIKLRYEEKEGQELLSGKWKGDWSLKTCAPGTSGGVDLARVKPLNYPAIIASRNDEPMEIKSNDLEGQALAKELANRNYYALIIGVNSYNDDGIQDLDNPVSDAKALSEVLTEYYTFRDENVVFLANPTRSAIIESFDAMNAKIKEKDHLLVFYAGHGIWDENLNQGFWLPSDASVSSKAQWLSNSTIRDYIGGIKAKHTLLVTDACFSGSIFKERSVSFVNSRAMLEMYKLPSRKAMTSGALKTVPDKSVFITYLVKNLRTNEQPLLSAEDLFGTFKIAVINNSPNGQVPQYGAIGQAGDEGGDFIFLKKQKD